LISMGPGAVGAEVTIPGVFVGQTAGEAMVNWANTNPTTAQLQLSTIAFQLGNTPDEVIAFSSRGPGVGNVLKPDIAAPGVNILAQGFDPAAGNEGEDRHHGFGQVSGTSMAAPHVSGAGILLKQLRPNWSPAWIKSALMTTSKYLDIYTEDGRPAQPLDMGAGRLDLTRAADPGVILDPPNLSYGVVTMGEAMTMTVALTSVADTTETYNVTTLDTRDGYTVTKVLAGVVVTPTTVTLAPGATAQVSIRLSTADMDGDEGDQQGFVVMKSANHEAHAPLWVRVGYAPNPEIGRVLVVDNDGSSSLGGADYPDFTPYYTETLENLGITYDVLDVDENAGNTTTLPEAVYLDQYDAIIYQTGNNYLPNGTFTVPTPPTTLDMNRLVEYANNGGAVLAFGQDLSSVTGGGGSNPPFFFSFTLGARFLQDGINDGVVFTQTAQLLNGVPPLSPFRNMSFDISDRGDGAGNQAWIDELGVNCTDPDFLLCSSIPLLQYGVRGNDVENGYVAIATRDFPSLERPGVSNTGETMYFGFGLEGVNNDTGFNTREDLLGTALRWAWDEPTVTINVRGGMAMPGRVAIFDVEMESEFGGEVVSVRWDFGDGAGFTNPYPTSTASHTYDRPGRYVVRIQVTNELGTTVIAERVVQVGYPTFLPIVMR
jgi:hypothetical protein